MAFNTAQFVTLATSELEDQISARMNIAAAIRFAVISSLLMLLGFTPPKILSGFRSLDHQRALREQLGDKAASRSWHTVGLAYDLDSNSPSFDLFARLWVALGGRDGRNFNTPDKGHLDFPVEGIVPQSIG